LVIGTAGSTAEQSKIKNQKSKIEDLDAHLAPGEVILWRGKPERRPFIFRTWPLSIFGIALIVAALFYEVIVLTTEAPDLLSLPVLPFLLVALYMAFGHFFVTAREWTNTDYVVTERQVLIRHGILTPTVTKYSLHGLPLTTIEMRGHDIGNLLFKPREGQGYGPYPGYQTMWPYTPDYVLGFLFIHNPQHVQQIIEQAQRPGVKRKT
jgi:hypothetical protein